MTADWNGDNWTPEQFAAWLEKQTWTDHSPHYGPGGAVVNPPYAKAAALIHSLQSRLASCENERALDAKLLDNLRLSWESRLSEALKDRDTSEQVLHALQEKFGAQSRELVGALDRLDRALKALRELNAEVWGECPSLMSEDSGGNGRLAVEIEDLLKDDCAPCEHPTTETYGPGARKCLDCGRIVETPPRRCERAASTPLGEEGVIGPCRFTHGHAGKCEPAWPIPVERGSTVADGFKALAETGPRQLPTCCSYHRTGGNERSECGGEFLS